MKLIFVVVEENTVSKIFVVQSNVSQFRYWYPYEGLTPKAFSLWKKKKASVNKDETLLINSDICLRKRFL